MERRFDSIWFADDEQIQSGRPGGRSDAQHQIDPGLWPLHVQLLRGRFGFFTYIEIGLQLYAFVSCFTPVWVSLHCLKLNEKILKNGTYFKVHMCRIVCDWSK